MGMNAIEKILANHSEQDVVRPGDVVMVDVDVTVQFDHARPDVLQDRQPRQGRAAARPRRAGADGAGGEQRQAAARVRRAVRDRALLPGRASTASRTSSSPARAIALPGPDPRQRRLAHLLVGGDELPRPRHGRARDALHHVQGPDLVPGRPDHQGRARGRAARAGLPAGRHPLPPRAPTATSPAATSSGTATACRPSASTAASRWRRSPPSCRPSSRCSPTTTCSPSTSTGGPSGRSSRRSPTTTPSTTR